jgi:HlyD family secretion protein
VKGLKSWQKFLLFLIVLLVAGGSYGVYYWLTKPDTSTQSNVQLTQAQLGNITNTVSASGSLIFGSKESMSFGSAGTVAEVTVKEGDSVTEGQIIAQLDETSLIPLQQAVVQAQINLESAMDTTQAEINVTAAKIAVETAQKNLENAQTPYSETDILQAEVAVTNAKIALANAQESYDKSKTKYDSNPTVPEWILDYELKTAQLALAESNLENAEETLSDMRSGGDLLQIELKKQDFAAAKDNLIKAQAQLAGIKGDTTTLEGQLKQLQIAAAQNTLDTAIERVENAIIKAPCDGIITALNVISGQTISANAVVAEVTDPSVIEVSAVLDEIDVPLVEIGQKTIVTLSSISDLELEGVVSAISTTARSQSGVVTYTVTISITPPEDIPLREGLSATADIVVEEANNVVTIPEQAVISAGNASYVQVMVNGVLEQKQIGVGLSDGSYCEVKNGLTAGDQVVLQQTSTSSSTTTRQNSQGTMFPGGANFPGGGGIIIREEIR